MMGKSFKNEPPFSHLIVRNYNTEPKVLVYKMDMSSRAPVARTYNRGYSGGRN
jgi:hypothetical protein